MTDDIWPETNQEYMASTRSIIHIPPLLLPPHHRIGMGSRLRGRCITNDPNHPRLRLRTFPSDITPRLDGSILSRWQAFGTRNHRSSRSTETRTLRSTGGRSRRRTTRVRILFRCLDTSILSNMGVLIRGAVLAHACHQSRLLGKSVLRKFTISHCIWILFCHHVLGLQWYVSPSRFYLRQSFD